MIEDVDWRLCWDAAQAARAIGLFGPGTRVRYVGKRQPEHYGKVGVIEREAVIDVVWVDFDDGSLALMIGGELLDLEIL